MVVCACHVTNKKTIMASLSASQLLKLQWERSIKDKEENKVKYRAVLSDLLFKGEPPVGFQELKPVPTTIFLTPEEMEDKKKYAECIEVLKGVVGKFNEEASKQSSPYMVQLNTDRGNPGVLHIGVCDPPRRMSF